MEASQFLSPKKQRQYLYDRGYFPAESITDSDLNRVTSVNFHHFLGYARNYRKLVDDEIIRGPKNIEDVFNIIDTEHQISTLLYEGLRRAEWNLRSLAVKHFCQRFGATQTFLDPNQYTSHEEDDSRHLVAGLMKSIFRYGEPYVAERIETELKSKGLKKSQVSIERLYDDHADIFKDLEFWSIVDSLSLGQLAKFIMTCTPQSDTAPIWRDVASDLDIAKQLFHTNLVSLAVTRNMVAHNVRLWMKPTTQSPKKPKIFKRQLRDSHDKSMHVAFLNVALFQPDQETRAAFIQNLNVLLNANEIYRKGVTTLPFSRTKSSINPMS